MDKSGLRHLNCKENLKELRSMMCSDPDSVFMFVCVSASRNSHSQVLETGILVFIFMPQGLRTHTDSLSQITDL